MKVKMVNSAGCLLDFDSIRDADQHLNPQWRDFAIVAYGKDEMGNTREYLYVPPTSNNLE